MILETSSSVDELLSGSAAEIEANERGSELSPLRYPRCRLPKSRFVVRVQSPRPLNALEEFVPRGADELDPSPTRKEAASPLGTDLLFIGACCHRLEGVDVVEACPEGAIGLTADGRRYYTEGRVPKPP